MTSATTVTWPSLGTVPTVLGTAVSNNRCRWALDYYRKFILPKFRTIRIKSVIIVILCQNINMDTLSRTVNLTWKSTFFTAFKLWLLRCCTSGGPILPLGLY